MDLNPQSALLNGSDSIRSEPLPSLSIEERLSAVEEKIARFENALFGAAKQLLDNPMASAMLPKEMKTTLREYLGVGTEAKNVSR